MTRCCIVVFVFIFGCSLISSLVLPRSKVHFSGIKNAAPFLSHGIASESLGPRLWSAIEVHCSSKLSTSVYMRKSRPSFQNILRRILLGLLSVFVGIRVPRVLAATSKSYPIPKLYGWDLYGRVPYDDSMFSSWHLSDPNILKRSIVEEVVSEIPDVLENFRRNKILHDLRLYGRGIVGVLIAVYTVGLLLTKAKESISKDREKETSIIGYSMPISANYKKAQFKGKEVAGMDGWIDMGGRGDAGDDEDEDDDEDDEEE